MVNVKTPSDPLIAGLAPVTVIFEMPTVYQAVLSGVTVKVTVVPAKTALNGVLTVQFIEGSIVIS
jgi:hypothetical protein